MKAKIPVSAICPSRAILAGVPWVSISSSLTGLPKTIFLKTGLALLAPFLDAEGFVSVFVCTFSIFSPREYASNHLYHLSIVFVNVSINQIRRFKLKQF